MALLNEEYFSGILKEMLAEAVQSNRIITSIKNRVVNKIFYDGENTMKPGYRSIEVYCFGLNHNGNAVIRAWQREGVSDTPYGNGYDKLTEKPGWRMFRVDGIKSFNNTNQRFNSDSEYLKQERPNYNAHDKDMKQIYYALESDNGHTNNSVDNTRVDTNKVDTSPAANLPVKKPLFKSSADKPLFGSERDEKEKNNSTNIGNSRNIDNRESMFKK